MTGNTIYDVAARAGVSISTVSRVLNAPEQVNEATRTRVLAAIDELGFVPRADATARARRGTGRIGVLAPFFSQPLSSFLQRLRGISQALAETFHELVIYNVDSLARRDSYLATLPVTRRLDGLVIMSLPFDDTVAQRLIANALPTVLIECTHQQFSSIEIDDQAGGRMVAEYLAERGHRQLGFVGDSDVPGYALRTSERRLAGYREGLARRGIELPPAYVVLAPRGLDYACDQAHQLLSLDQPPTAIFAQSDMQAMGVLKAARQRGLAVPGDLAVVGFDDLDVADFIGLTTVRQPLDESGRIAAELMQARLADPTRPVQHVRLMLTLVRRATA